MTKSLIIRADGSIELTDTPAHETTPKYKKFITDRFSRDLPDTVFKSLGREDGGMLHLLALYRGHLDFFEIVEPVFYSCKTPHRLPTGDDPKRINLFYAFFEELMFAGYDLFVLHGFADNCDDAGLEAVLRESKIEPGSLLYDFSFSIYKAHLPGLDLTGYIGKLKEIAERYPWFIHSRIFVMASRFGRSLSWEEGANSKRDLDAQMALKELKDLLKESYPFSLKRGRITGKKYTCVEKEYQRDLESMYIRFHFMANSMLDIVRKEVEHGIGKEQIICDLNKRYSEIAGFKCTRLSKDEISEIVYKNSDLHPSKIAKKLMSLDMDVSQYTLKGLKLNGDLAIRFHLERGSK